MPKKSEPTFWMELSRGLTHKSPDAPYLLFGNPVQPANIIIVEKHSVFNLITRNVAPTANIGTLLLCPMSRVDQPVLQAITPTQAQVWYLGDLDINSAINYQTVSTALKAQGRNTNHLGLLPKDVGEYADDDAVLPLDTEKRRLLQRIPKSTHLEPVLSFLEQRGEVELEALGREGVITYTKNKLPHLFRNQQ